MIIVANKKKEKHTKSDLYEYYITEKNNVEKAIQ